MPELDGEVAIVTGAGRLRGIGRSASAAWLNTWLNVSLRLLSEMRQH